MKSARCEAVGDLVKAVGGEGVEPTQGFRCLWNTMFGVAGDEEGDTGREVMRLARDPPIAIHFEADISPRHG